MNRKELFYAGIEFWGFLYLTDNACTELIEKHKNMDSRGQAEKSKYLEDIPRVMVLRTYIDSQKRPFFLKRIINSAKLRNILLLIIVMLFESHIIQKSHQSLLELFLLFSVFNVLVAILLIGQAEKREKNFAQRCYISIYIFLSALLIFPTYMAYRYSMTDYYALFLGTTQWVIPVVFVICVCFILTNYLRRPTFVALLSVYAMTVFSLLQYDYAESRAFDSGYRIAMGIIMRGVLMAEVIPIVLGYRKLHTKRKG